MKLLKDIYVWIRRFRKRRGYGVHSPLAFSFITEVVYERSPYYAYDKIKSKDERLLFRVANYAHPRFVYEAGKQHDALPLVLSVPSAQIVNASTLGRNEVDFVHMPVGTDFAEEFRRVAPLLSQKALMVCEGIRTDSVHLEQWKQIVENERTGITFDLYNIGIAMFDQSRIKQDYTVNY